MPKYKFAIGPEAANAELGFNNKKPPAGIFTLAVKKFSIRKNKNDDDMLEIISEVAESGAKEKHNGYGVWQRFNVTEQGAPYLNEFLDAIGIKRNDFWNGNLVVDGNGQPPCNVLKIGLKKVEGLQFRANLVDDEYNGKTRLVVSELINDGDEEEEAEEEELAETLLEDPEGDGGDEDAYTEADLADLTPADLREILDGWEVEYAAKATSKTLIKLILLAQEPESEESEPEPEAVVEEEPEAEAEEQEEEASEVYTDEELNELDSAELKQLITENGWTMPKPPVKSKLVKAILAAQAKPPF